MADEGELERLRAENHALRERLARLENKEEKVNDCGLTNTEIERYSRQLLTPQFGVEAQRRLKHSSVLVIGAGGLGCPVLQYLAGAGIGHIGVVDNDEVSVSNLHRQVLHRECDAGRPKVFSARDAVARLNSTVRVSVYNVRFTSENALGIVKGYDIVVDASDNVATRYLVNDSAILSGKPLVSASAVKMEGQLTVYGDGGPCYRCLFPTPPPPETVSNCADGGVLGVVPGILGCLQALETIKIASGVGKTLSQQLLIFDGHDGRIRTVKLRPKKADCALCGEAPAITALVDYVQFCGSAMNDDPENPQQKLNAQETISTKDFSIQRCGGDAFIVVDVRPPEQFAICSLPEARNYPLALLMRPGFEGTQDLTDTAESMVERKLPFTVYVICRRGIDSQTAVRHLLGTELGRLCPVKNVWGGILSWRNHVDPTFPLY